MSLIHPMQNQRRRFLLAGTIVGLISVLIPAGLTVAAGNKSGNNKKVGRKRVVVIGASYAKSWNIREISGLEVVNRGAGGEQTHEVLSRFERDAVAPKPRAVIIWGFINDIFRSTPEEVESKLQKTRQNLSSMVNKARQAGVVPILATEVTLPIPDNWTYTVASWIGKIRGKKGQQEYVNGHVLEINRWIRQYAADNRVALLDFERVLAGEGGGRRLEFTTKDGTHLSAKAYDALTTFVGRQDLML